MMLEKLVKNLEVDSFDGDKQVDIDDIAYSSNNVKEGSCFVAIAGLKLDGHRFINDAIARGAKVIVSEQKVDVPDGVTNIVVKDTRDALARLSANYFGVPTKQMRLVGVTGTNGKTTITYLLESIFKATKLEPGVIGTINYRYGGANWPSSHTTPESYDLQKILRRMADADVTDVVMEVSSHAIDMERVVGCHFDGAIFTNLTPEHLDYHGDIEAYFASKARLFQERLMASEKKDVWAVINWDDPRGRTLVGSVACRVLRYSLKDKVDVYCDRLKCGLNGIDMRIVTPCGSFEVSSALKGAFNASNILAAAATGCAMGIGLQYVLAGIENVKVVPGRMESVSNNKGIFVFVDYAHTPDALENVLDSIKQLKPKKIITVFGCGGDRDRLKRPLMGEAVAKLSNVAVVTSDNPRNEDPDSIIDQVLVGVIKAMRKFDGNEGYIVLPDRREAITKAIKLAGKEDVVLIAGKGHEDYQIIGGIRKDFDDRKVASEILNG